MAAPRSLVPQQQQKRKSAVELLAETKAFYVKSETVLDRKQELPLRVRKHFFELSKSKIFCSWAIVTFKLLLEFNICVLI